MDKGERIYKELQHEHVSIWYISDEFGSKVMVKLPSVSIKALIKGCPISFLFGVDKRKDTPIFHNGVRVFDDPVHFLSVIGTQRFLDEHTSLEKIMNRDWTYIHFHSELGICVAIAELRFDVKDQLKVLNILGKVENLYCGDFDNDIKHSLDCFDYSLDQTRNFKDVYPIDMLTVNGYLSNWSIMKNHFIGINETNSALLNDKTEGDIFEIEIWAALESIFDAQIYKNPKVPYKNNTRELIDVLAYSDYGIFLIETKAIGIYNTNPERSMERKVSNLKNQIDKAINQLIGASKKIAENTAIYSSLGISIDFNRGLLPHCIVLISELLQFGDWKDIELRMLKVMIENRIYIHVMDFKEFMKFIKASGGNKDKLDYYLVKRCEDFVACESIHMSANFTHGSQK